jgi:hypothetical protein
VRRGAAIRGGAAIVRCEAGHRGAKEERAGMDGVKES